MKKEFIQLAKEIVAMTICCIIVFTICDKIFNKAHSIENIIGFIVGWTLYKTIEILIKNKKQV